MSEGRARRRAVLAVLATALVPGMGHALVGRTARGVLYLFLVSGALVVGVLLEGRFVAFDPAQPLSFVASLPGWVTGLPGLLARWAGLSAGDMRTASHEIGTTFLVSSGLMNLLLLFDAWDVALGRKP